jgi:aerotaxis receptor
VRNNQPVTRHEYVLKDGAAIISRTDSRGIITDCNEEFVEISGFTLGETLGQPHNMVRHPDMPPAAFKDLWQTLKRGRPWVGFVKNRRKNGDFYWVRASVAPLPDGNGYSSVRTKPSREQVEQAEALYRRMNNGEDIRLHEGEVVSRGFSLVTFLRSISISSGIWATSLFACAQFVAMSIFSHHIPLSMEALWTITMLGCIAMLTGAWLNVGHLRNRLLIAEEAVGAIAEGDLTRPIPSAGEDELGNLIVKIAIMRNALHELIAAVRQNVETLHRSSTELSHSAADSAQVSIRQSEAAASMAAAIEQLSVSVDVVESNSRRALGITQASAQRSQEGGKIILTATGEMENIATAVKSTADTIRALETISNNISGIAGVINEIAEQTNLLALNAAIEAARAGDAGRGFAVVADEVRKLSERTAQSTQEISSMITEIQNGTSLAVREMDAGVTRVNHGVELAGQAGEAIAAISDGAEQIATDVNEISHALHEQASAARDIARKVEEIALGAETNSASAGHTATSAQELQAISQRLQSLASRFRIA